MKQFTVENDGVRLGKFLTGGQCGISYSYYKSLLKEKEIKVNGIRVREDVVLYTGDIVTVYLDEQKLRKEPLRLLYSSGDILVFHKPRKISVEAFAARVRAEYGENAVLAHRLDTNTEGLLLFSKNDQAEKELDKAFRSGYIDKAYYAAVFGNFTGEKTFTDYLLKDAAKGVVTVCKDPCPGAARIITRASAVKTLKPGETLLSVALLTGKTHQIRAHLSFYGYPVAGDTKYGDFEKNRKYGYTVQKLTAYRICFQFPKESFLSYLNETVIETDADFL